MSLVLASQSPRRRELLDQIGVSHRVIAVEVDESRLPAEPPAVHVERLARAKAMAGMAAAAGDPVIGADTVVVVDDDVLGKPADRDDALAILGRLSGRRHDVLTAVALGTSVDNIDCRLSVSHVTFRTLGAEEIAAYWDSGEPADKAGAYAIQGRAALFVTHLEGSYTGVMGLPLFETGELLRAAGLAPGW